MPVKLYSSVSRKTVRFHQLNGKTGHRIAQKRVDPGTSEEVTYEDIVKGYELTKDRYVVITPEELEALDPEKSRTIDIEDFVDLADIDPVYYDHPYYLVPDKGAAKAYGLLLHAMQESDKVAIARVVLRSKEQLVAIRPAPDGVLMMETMIFADEVVPPDEIDDLPAAKDLKVSDRELKMAQQLIDSLSSDFEPEKYRDEYREKVLELIERKASGEEIAVQPEAPEPKKVPDLMAALEASLAAVKGDERRQRQDGAEEEAGAAQEGRGEEVAAPAATPLRGRARTRRGSRRCAPRPSGPRARARGTGPSPTGGRVGIGLGTSNPAPGVADLDPQHAVAGHDDELDHVAVVQPRVPDRVRDQLGHQQPRVLEPPRGEVVGHLPERPPGLGGGVGIAREVDLVPHVPRRSPPGIVDEVEALAHARDLEHPHHLLGAGDQRKPAAAPARAPTETAITRSPLESMNADVAQVQHDGPGSPPPAASSSCSAWPRRRDRARR